MVRKLLSLGKPAGAVGLLLALILIFGFAGYALAVPQAPHQFYGQVTVGGDPAPEGIEVVAKIGGVQDEVKTVTDAQGRYGYEPMFYVPADDPDTPDKEGGRNGDVIQFYVDGVQATTYEFEIGGHTKLDLAIEALPDTTAPTVEGTDPADGATDVPVSASITVTFSEDVQEGASFDQIALEDAEGSTVGCNVTLSGDELTIDPQDNLAYGTTYTVTIPAGAVKDRAGNALAAQSTFSFTTVVDAEAPTVSDLAPADGSVIGEARPEISAVVTDGLSGVDASSIVLKVDGNVVTHQYDAQTGKVSCTPDTDLADGAHTVYLEVKDMVGNQATEQWSFTVDTTAPAVASTDPADGAESVPVDAVITMTFSEDVQEGASFDQIALEDAEGSTVACDVALSGDELTIDPQADLNYNATYTVTIPAGAVEDRAGNALAAQSTFSFTTEAAPVILEQLQVTPDSLTLTVGEQAQLEVKAVYSDGTEADVTAEASYTSGDESVAMVSDSGLVTAVAAGETVVTVDYGDKSAQVPVAVTEAAPETYTVTFAVTDQEQNAIQGAEIAIEGVEGTLVTDENGVATVELPNGDYSFTVTAEGYQDYQGSFEVVDQAVAVAVTMQAAEGEQPPAEVTDLVVTPLPGAGAFGISFTAPSDSDLRGVAVYGALYGSNDWEQVEFENGSMVYNCQPGESVDIGVQVPGNLVLGSDRVQFKVVAVDYSGNESQGVVANNNGQGYPVLARWELMPGPEGWSTFSVPVQLAGDQKLVGDVIDPDKVEIALKFDATAQQWVQVTEENKNNSIQPLEAVYVKLREPVLAVIKPSTDPTSPSVRNLLKGWNLVGFTKADNIYDALYSVREHWSVAVSPAVNPDAWAVTPRQDGAVKTHYGYWVYMDESGTLAGFSATPVTVGTYPFERE